MVIHGLKVIQTFFDFSKCGDKIADLWDELQDQYITEFGLDESFKKQIRLLKEKAILNYNFILTKDPFINTELSIIEADLTELNTGKSVGFYEMKSHLEKYKGFRIPVKEVTKAQAKAQIQ